MTTSHSNLYLPQDILVKILHLLPFASLVKLKRVSKEWKAVINDPKFFNRYHDRSLTLFVSRGSLFCVFPRHNADNKPAIDPPCTVRHVPIRLEGEVNGALRLVSEPSDTMACVVLANYRFLLHNLFTGASHTVADAPEGFYARWSCYGSGYDHYADDHKITAVVKKKPTMNDADVGSEREGELRFWIYSFRNRAWKRLQGFPYDMFNWTWTHRACSSNGVLHWVFSREENEEKPAIVTYDLCTRRFGEMSAPPTLDRSNWIHRVFQVGGQLCYGYFDRRVFHMKEYGLKESWAKLFTIDRSLLAIDKLRIRDGCLDGSLMKNMALCEPRDGEKIVVFWSDYNRHLIWYDVKDGSAQVVDYATSLET